MENSMEASQKIKNRNTIKPSNSSSGYTSKKIEALIWKDIFTPMFIASLITTAKLWKQANHPSKDVVNIHFGVLAIKIEWNFAICDNMDWSGEYYIQ